MERYDRLEELGGYRVRTGSRKQEVDLFGVRRHREGRRQVNQSRSPGFLNDAPPGASSLHLRVGRSPLNFSGAQLIVHVYMD